MEMFRSVDYVFAVVGGKLKDGNFYDVREICGTAFYLTHDFFITAGHVIKNALAYGEIHMGFIDENGALRTKPVLNYEVIGDYDIGILQAETPTDTEIPAAKAFRWNFDSLDMLDNVETVGFPFALDFDDHTLSVRSFKGYIVSGYSFSRLQAKPLCYELSFNCPRGISGAPIFSDEEEPRVKGMILENHSIQIPVGYSKEISKDDHKERIIETYETTYLGIALNISSIKDVPSTLLDGSVFEFLKKAGLA